MAVRLRKGMLYMVDSFVPWEDGSSNGVQRGIQASPVGRPVAQAARKAAVLGAGMAKPEASASLA